MMKNKNMTRKPTKRKTSTPKRAVRLRKRVSSTVQLTLKGVPVSEALKTHVYDKAEKLKRYRVTHCRIVIELPEKHKHQGKLYAVHIELSVPGKVFAVTRKQAEDVYVAVRDAFKVLERQLAEYTSKQDTRSKRAASRAKGVSAAIGE
jgi:ribosomal subunit interface protein